MAVFFPKTYHSAAGCPKKVENTSSENTTFDNSEHPYRTCGSSVCVFFLFGSSPMSVFLWKTNDFLKILGQIFDFLLNTNNFHRLSLKSSNFKWKTDDFLRLLCKSMIFHQNINGKAINFKEHQWNYMKSIQMSPNMDQNRWTPLKNNEKPWCAFENTMIF